MSASHFVIWGMILVSFFTNAFIGWYVRQLWNAEKQRNLAMDQLLKRLTPLERWSSAFAQFGEDLSKRVIAIEISNKGLTALRPKEDEEDPFSGPRSWQAQAAAAERAEGVSIRG